MADTSERENEPTFEEALARLEKIVAEMEAGNLRLEESMARFEEGMALSRFCANRLEATEKKIEMLVRKADESLEWQPVDLAPGPAESGTDSPS